MQSDKEESRKDMFELSLSEVGLAAPNGGGQFVVAGGLAGYSLGRKKARNETPEKW